MAKVEVPFAMQEGKAGFTQNSRETLINMYATIVNSGRVQIVRQQRPGLVSVGGPPDLESRCIETHRANTYFIAGNSLYLLTQNPLTIGSPLGTLSTFSGRCSMIFNDNDQVMISDGENAYCYTPGGALVNVTLPSGVTCGTLAYLGGFGIFNAVGTGKFYITGLNDFLTVDALDFATAEASPDNLVTVYVDHGELWLAGVHTTEVWALTGGSDFPFTPVVNAVLERGCAAALSYGDEDNTIMFLGDDRIVYRADGYRPARISTNAIEDAVSRCTDLAIAAAYSMIYTVRGNKFYTLTFPGELTVQYNIATGLWNRCESYGFNAWNIIGSRNTRSDYFLTLTDGVCSLDPDDPRDVNGVMRRGGISAPGWDGGNDISVHMVSLDAEVGRRTSVPTIGASSLPSASNVMMRFAKDGETFGNERWRTLGETGNFKKKVIWRDLGRGTKPTIEFFITDPVPFKVNNIAVEVS